MVIKVPLGMEAEVELVEDGEGRRNIVLIYTSSHRD